MNIEQMALDKCKKVIDYYNMYGNFPSQTHSVDEFRKLGVWLSVMKTRKQGKGSSRNVYHESLQILAEKHGLPDMFNTNKNKKNKK